MYLCAVLLPVLRHVSVCSVASWDPLPENLSSASGVLSLGVRIDGTGTGTGTRTGTGKDPLVFCPNLRSIYSKIQECKCGKKNQKQGSPCIEFL